MSGKDILLLAVGVGLGYYAVSHFMLSKRAV